LTTDIKPLFSGEVLFRRWSDSSTQGVQVTFALADAEELAPLKGLEGKRFACVLVRINDDETLSQEPPQKRGGFSADVGPKAREAIQLCGDPRFQQYVATVTGEAASAENAKDWLLIECGGIRSRKDLDGDQIAGELFIERVRVPFIKWQRAQQKRAA
jgi:hypothetical protein